MAPEDANLPDVPDAVVSVLQTFQNDAPAAVAQLQPLADGGDMAANLALMRIYWDVGWPGGIPYAMKVAKAGIATPFLQNYVSNMIGSPEHHADALILTREIIDSAGPAYPVDVLAYAIQAAQQGHTDLARQLMQLSLSPSPPGARQQWDQIVADVRLGADEIKTNAATSNAERDRVLAEMRGDENRINDERERIEQLVQDVTDLAHKATSQHLAKEYAKHAEAVEEDAERYTKWSIGVTVAAAIGSIVIAYFAFSQESGVGPILTKASLALPVLAVAAYISRLATIHRRQAWRWRHIELQIATAEPYLSPLDDAERKTLIAALALRFFPGQRHAGADEEAESPTDPAAVLGDLLGRPRGSSRAQEPPTEQEVA